MRAGAFALAVSYRAALRNPRVSKTAVSKTRAVSTVWRVTVARAVAEEFKSCLQRGSLRGWAKRSRMFSADVPSRCGFDRVCPVRCVCVCVCGCPVRCENAKLGSYFPFPHFQYLLIRRDGHATRCTAALFSAGGAAARTAGIRTAGDR